MRHPPPAIDRLLPTEYVVMNQTETTFFGERTGASYRYCKTNVGRKGNTFQAYQRPFQSQKGSLCHPRKRPLCYLLYNY
jgi:hypothetical protein